MDNSNRKNIYLSSEDGQSTIEFLMSFTFVFVLLLMCVNFAISSVNGYLVHYATFMASRTYLVFDNNSPSPDGADALAFNAAEAEYQRYPLDLFLGSESTSLKVNHPGYGGKTIYIGLYSEFKQNFAIPGMFGGSDKLNLKSESFLGREPTRATCVERICKAMSDVGGACGDLNTTYFDNGC